MSRTKVQKEFDAARAVALLPGELEKQKDCMGRPIKIGDRVDDCTDYLGGIIVAVFGSQCVYLTDSEGILGLGCFATQNCDEVRLLPPVTDVETTVAELLAYRATIDDERSGAREPLLVPNVGQAIGLTYLDGERAKDANGVLIHPGRRRARNRRGNLFRLPGRWIRCCRRR